MGKKNSMNICVGTVYGYYFQLLELLLNEARENECLGKFSPASSHCQHLQTNLPRTLLRLKNLFDYYLIVFPSDDDENEHANKNLKAF
jgi:hypothetical protein